MFHRPLATVLSSVSIRNLLSTRNFCSPVVTSIEDEITTVRTTGIRWTKDDVYGTINGIYWGEGDSRNTKLVINQDTTNSRYIQLQSIVLALEQAKKDGLKRIRVQTDSDMNEFSIRAEAKMYSNLDPEERKRLQYRNMAYCVQIATFMDEIEVILECKSLPNNGSNNEVIDLLKEGDKPNQDGNSYDMSKHLLETVSQRSITLNYVSLKKERTLRDEVERSSLPKMADNDAIPTVRTTGMRYDMDGGGTLTGVYWGEGDPRNVFAKKGHDKSDWDVANLRSILIALEQARNDGLKRIRVLTDSRIDDASIRRMGRSFKSMDLMKKTDPAFVSFAYCEKIVKIMDKMEVILERQYAKNGISVVALLKADRNRKNPNNQFVSYYSSEYQSDFTITPKDASPLEGRIVPTVYVTGRMHNDADGVIAAVWATESIEHLDHKQRPIGLNKRLYGFTRGRVRMDSILEAIREAKSFNLPEIQVVTDNLEFIEFFKVGWRKFDGSVAPHDISYRKIKALTDTIKVHFKGVRLTEDCDDELMKKVYEMATIPESKASSANGNEPQKDEVPDEYGKAEATNSNSPDVEPDWTITPKDASPLEGRIVPTVYIARKLNSEKDVSVGTSLWVPESIEHLDNDQRPKGSIQLIAVDKSNTMRPVLILIRDSIKEAKASNLAEIRVITEWSHFFVYYQSGWLMESGRIAQNKDVYHEIKSLSESTKVHFKRERLRFCDRMFKKVQEALQCSKSMSGDELVTFLNKDETESDSNYVSSTSSNYKSDWTITPKGASPLEGRTVPTVYTVRRLYNDKMDGVGASMWDLESFKDLGIKQRPVGSIQQMSVNRCTRMRPLLISIRDAIKEAQKYNIPEIRVITDCLDFIHFFMREGRGRNGDLIHCGDVYLEIKELTETTKVHFKALLLTEDCDDELMKKVYEMATIPESKAASTNQNESQKEEVSMECAEANANSPECESDWTITPSDTPPLEGRTVPTVYVVKRTPNKLCFAVSLWVPKTIEHLEINQRPDGSIQQERRDRGGAGLVPLLIAIRDAIKKAQVLNISEIQIITVATGIIKYFKNEWIEDDGSYMPNEKLYFEIKALTETTKVHFKGLRFSDNEIVKEAYDIIAKM